ncbi:glycosyltransferase family 2 protein [Flavobacterium sp. ANB]|uniref:glycosyltransferase family A protein n=1 Tax=unclassified Flavobacterium TaxID=196869 RepID=UPI0012B6AE2F|nr:MULTISPECIES: glycosyltransferase family A protein [unclassified Flavobacterium]MBF4517584.1 glycosyltransferase family 2 protein [Flavobacterium sp. ANB]MTD70311.1 glycosyltransferase [Flavobacterium sp. LC2016-13]
MRVGYNPHKDEVLSKSEYLHQIIIPVFIPHQEEYFKDSFAILKLCLESLFATIHDKTFITIVNNGSDSIIVNYLDSLLKENKIQELIHTQNIGKLNAILKGLAGNNIELVTISDSDVLFLTDWQKETVNVFQAVPKAGVVGIVPQFKMYESNCGNLLFDTLLSSKLQFIPVKNQEGLVRFYDSLGWARDYNQDYLKYNLGLKLNENQSILVGSGHFVATYKKDIFEEITSYIEFKMGGSSEEYLDKAPLRKDYWRVTTLDNYAFHMGNTLEEWMTIPQVAEINTEPAYGFSKNKKANSFIYWLKNRLFVKFISIKILVKLFLKWKKLPKEMISKY